MNKGELIDKLASVVDSSVSEANRNVKAFIDIINTALLDGDTVTIPGFGTFTTSHRPAREGRNPQTGESMEIGPRTAVKFKPSKTLKEALNSSK